MHLAHCCLQRINEKNLYIHNLNTLTIYCTEKHNKQRTPLCQLTSHIFTTALSCLIISYTSLTNLFLNSWSVSKMVVRICSSVAYFLVGFFFFGTCEFYESFLLKQVDTGLCLRNAHRDIILFSSVRCLENKKFCLQKKPKKNQHIFCTQLSQLCTRI